MTEAEGGVGSTSQTSNSKGVRQETKLSYNVDSLEGSLEVSASPFLLPLAGFLAGIYRFEHNRTTTLAVVPVAKEN